MNNPFATDVAQLLSYLITGRSLVIFILLILLAFARREALSNQKVWQKSRDVINPSLQPSPPPIVTAQAGLMGCFWFYIFNGIGLLLLFAVVDLLVSGGVSLLWLWQNSADLLSSSGQIIREFLRQIASALL